MNPDARSHQAHTNSQKRTGSGRKAECSLVYRKHGNEILTARFTRRRNGGSRLLVWIHTLDTNFRDQWLELPYSSHWETLVLPTLRSSTTFIGRVKSSTKDENSPVIGVDETKIKDFFCRRSNNDLIHHHPNHWVESRSTQVAPNETTLGVRLIDLGSRKLNPSNDNTYHGRILTQSQGIGQRPQHSRTVLLVPTPEGLSIVDGLLIIMFWKIHLHN